MSTTRQPAIFIPHGGGPCFFMDWTWGPADTWHATQRFLESLAATLPERPSAILVISGHWEEPALTAGAAAKPELIFDYSGFPQQTYELTWPAPGDPALAARVSSLLQAAGMPSATDTRRGYDHGVFVPLKVAFPGADIPVVTLSLDHSLDPALHIAAGRALAPLRDEGVLIVASGMSFHNLRGYFQPQTAERSHAFDAWLTQAIQSPAKQRNALLEKWRSAPFATYAHPREEHLIPLMVATGAADQDAARLAYNKTFAGLRLSAFHFGES